MSEAMNPQAWGKAIADVIYLARQQGREEERARIVALLRTWGPEEGNHGEIDLLTRGADRIERGEK